MTTISEAPAQRLVLSDGENGRRRLRRRLFRIGVVPLLLATLLVAKVALMLYATHAGRVAYDERRYDDAASSFAAAGVLNALEPWVASYNQGTAAFQRGDYLSARSRFEEALRKAPPADQCRVRTNLALTNESLGDATLADGKVLDARTQWQVAQQLLADQQCTTKLSAAQDVDRSVAKKLASTRAAADAAQSLVSDQAAQALQERNQRAEQEHRQHEQEPSESPQPSSGADPPVYQW